MPDTYFIDMDYKREKSCNDVHKLLPTEIKLLALNLKMKFITFHRVFY